MRQTIDWWRGRPSGCNFLKMQVKSLSSVRRESRNLPLGHDEESMAGRLSPFCLAVFEAGHDGSSGCFGVFRMHDAADYREPSDAKLGELRCVL